MYQQRKCKCISDLQLMKCKMFKNLSKTKFSKCSTKTDLSFGCELVLRMRRCIEKSSDQNGDGGIARLMILLLL
jgi:hypothetical protein